MKKTEMATILAKLDELAKQLHNEAQRVQEIRDDIENSGGKKRESRRSGQREKYRLEVTFPGEPNIKGKQAAQVFVEAISKMDIEEVAKLRIMAIERDEILLVSRRPDFERQEHYKQCGRYYIYTTNNTLKKIEYLEEISKRLKIDMKAKRVPV